MTNLANVINVDASDVWKENNNWIVNEYKYKYKYE